LLTGAWQPRVRSSPRFAKSRPPRTMTRKAQA